MTQFELQFYILITFLSYMFLLLVFHSKLRKLAFIPAVLFVICSLLLRLYVPIEKNADYGGYANFMFEEYHFQWKAIFSEPYFPLILNTLFKYTQDWKESLNGMYLINFVFSLIFYIWLAYRKNIKYWIKLIFFVFSYTLLTYTVLRNSPAYFLFGFLAYYLLLGKKFWAGYLGFLTHASALPALAATFLGFGKPTYKQFLLILLGALVFSSLLSLPYFSHITNRLDTYTDTNVADKYGVSIFHKLYLVMIIGLTLLIYKYKKTAVYNNFYCAIFLIYLILYFLNPVMAFRFSYYIIIYIVIYPFYGKLKYDKILNMVFSIVLGFVFYNIFFGSHFDLTLLK
ncbi:hypothetical protein FY557_18800 [Chryseobacterium sp. SN22]|uniref:EpsG family protein n=1 Tax=Chryseobacterium sp. SN22 TaxID=2606431 RepID=UPI0011EBAF8C|nr:EpsG family protein [Chryseobacterium sp. SN22]KAA0126161.1 hypothetical protein FY557_18800 [Chryseobacterium sp. SN22]